MSTEISSLLCDLVTVVLLVVIPILTKVAFTCLKTAAANSVDEAHNDTVSRILEEISDVVQMAVEATNQTYVDSIKNSDNPFTKTAQMEAFNKAYNTVISLLSEEAKKYLQEAFGSAEVYLNTCIESEVQRQKLKKQSDTAQGILLEPIDSETVEASEQ